MRAAVAFIGAKQSFDDGCSRLPRPVLVGMEGNFAVLRRGPIRMDWEFVDDGSPEVVIGVCKERMLGTETVLVVPTMNRWSYAVCRAFGTGWCDSHGRCDVMVDAPGHIAHHRVWYPVTTQPPSIFDQQAVRDTAWFLAAQRRQGFSGSFVSSFLRPIQSAAKTEAALNDLVDANLVSRKHGRVRSAGWPVSPILLTLLGMPDDDLLPPDAATSRRMSKIRSRDTKPELLVRKTMHACGIRYRTCVAGLPGTPDLANKSAKWAVFVNGCFWHAHDCDNFRAPHRNAEFWREKFAATKQRDKDNQQKLRDMGYDVHVVWECDLADDPEGVIGDLVRRINTRR